MTPVTRRQSKRIITLLRDMSNSHKAYKAEGFNPMLHLEALEFTEEASDIMEELFAETRDDEAAATGFQIKEVLLDMLRRLPKNSQAWADFGDEVEMLERTHYELMQVRNRLDDFDILTPA